MYNIDVREALSKARVHGYEVAAALGMAETSFSRLLSRTELCEKRKSEILSKIGEITERG